MIDFTAVAVLAIRFRSVLRPFAIRPLVMLGQASLPVFCVHLLCVFFALTLMKNDPIIGGWKAIVVILASLSALLLTATVAANRPREPGQIALPAPSSQPQPLLVTKRGSRQRRWLEKARRHRVGSILHRS